MLFSFLILSMCVGVHNAHSTQAEVRRQLIKIRSPSTVRVSGDPVWVLRLGSK